MSKDKLFGIVNESMAWAWQQGRGYDPNNHEPQHEVDELAGKTKDLLARIPDMEELEKQVRQLKASDFAEIPYASKLRKVQLDGGQFVYEKVLRLIRKMEGEK